MDFVYLHISFYSFILFIAEFFRSGCCHVYTAGDIAIDRYLSVVYVPVAYLLTR